MDCFPQSRVLFLFILSGLYEVLLVVSGCAEFLKQENSHLSAPTTFLGSDRSPICRLCVRCACIHPCIRDIIQKNMPACQMLEGIRVGAMPVRGLF